MKRIHLIISGDVQGVGFRAWVLRQAQDFQLTGWVKNRDDGAVELVAEGEKNALEQLAAQCKKGPEVSWVEGVDIARQEATGEYIRFEVIY
jgi:acylphosphatase